LLAAQGWVVFEPNYRGSDNLGNEYQSAIFNDAGAGPTQPLSRSAQPGLSGITASFDPFVLPDFRLTGSGERL
jgi:hypothetical protein